MDMSYTIRLPRYDYSQPGAYFVTICAKERKHLLGRIWHETMDVNSLGEIIQQGWNEIPVHFPQCDIDRFVVMPNHVHGIV
jgi:putative transposase